VTNVIENRNFDLSEILASASKGSVRRQTTEAVKNGKGGRDWKQYPMSGRGKTSGDKVHGHQV
jgi:hypothetical protein